MRNLFGDMTVAFAFSFFVRYRLFIYGEWNLQAPAILACHILIFAVFSLEVLGGPRNIHQGCLRSLNISAVYITSLLLKIATYRLFSIVF
jgi:hypothetical protein